MFKKTLVSISLVALVSVSAQADKDFHVGVSQVDIFEQSTQVVNIGVGRDAVWNSCFMMGFNIDGSMGELKAQSGITTQDLDFYGFNFDLKLGFSPLNGLTVYGIGSGLVQKFDETAGAGAGFGGGANYAISDNFAISAEYKAYSMTYDSILDYDYTTAGVNLKYTW